MVATRVMQDSSNELTTLASERVKCKQTKFDIYTFIPELTMSRQLDLGLYQADVKLGLFQYQLGTTHVSNHTEVLWYNKTVYLWMKKKYIFI